MDEVELQFRDHQDYVSKYRKVLDYFDAVRIGLTATPALHTTEIFICLCSRIRIGKRSSTDI